MKIKKETLVRTLVLCIALINQVLTVFGFNPLPFSESQAYEALSLSATVVSALWAWWKNNSFTRAAREADEYLAQLKGEEE